MILGSAVIRTSEELFHILPNFLPHVDNISAGIRLGDWDVDGRLHRIGKTASQPDVYFAQKENLKSPLKDLSKK